MTTVLSPARRRLALASLALGGFALGCSEFVSMGLLPQIAQGLLGDSYATAPAATIAHAGLVISAYALGVVVGAPLIAVLGARMSRTRLLLGLLVALVVGTAASALLPTFGWILAARFVAGLPHGAYLGLAALLAGSIMGPGNQGKGVALALSGLTVANVIGVPVMTGLGQAYGWRTAFVATTALFVLTFALAMVSVPHQAGDPKASARRELRAFTEPQVWIVMGIAAIGFGGFFAVYSYLAEVTTNVAGLGAGAVPWVLGTVGVGMTLGNVVGGAAADRNLPAALLTGFPVLMTVLVVFALFSGTPAGLFGSAFFLGFGAFCAGPAIQTRLIRVAGEAQLLAAFLNHSAFNVGNTIGATLGGTVIAMGLGYLAPAWVGVVLAVGGLTLAVVSIRVEARRHPRPVPADLWESRPMAELTPLAA